MSEQNQQRIKQFYQAFSSKNFEEMADCYAKNIEFEDPVFGVLTGIKPSAMWRMLIEKSKDLKIEFDNVKADETVGSASWKATYPFGKTGRIIENSIEANFKFVNGKILYHKDNFSLWKWCSMAFGLSGLILGWSPFMQGPVRKEAKAGLDLFIKRRRLGED
jgi:hypothetical protein